MSDPGRDSGGRSYSPRPLPTPDSREMILDVILIQRQQVQDHLL